MEYFWGSFGFPTEGCDITKLDSISAWAWDGSVGSLNIRHYDFVADQPDPRSPDHHISQIFRVVHTYQDSETSEPEVEILLCLTGTPGATSWEMLRPLAYESSELAVQSFSSEHPWCGSPEVFKYQNDS